VISSPARLATLIDDAKKKLIELFATQCRDGAQSKHLEGKGMACGQFLGTGAAGLDHRGLHGTAAAIRVLAEASHAVQAECLPPLQLYVRDRQAIESGLGATPDRITKCADDLLNTVKVSELLYGVAHVRPVLQDKELLETLIQQLRDRRFSSQGWGYFLDDQSGPFPVPTAYAALALAKAGVDVRDPLAFLDTHISTTLRAGQRSLAESATSVLCLFVLTYANSYADDLATRARLVKYTRQLWSWLDPFMNEDFEQNIQYARVDRTYYLLVPWQLYLMAISAKLLPSRFASRRAQARLYAMLEAIDADGFRYEHSGDRLSCRTNGIAFDICGKLREQRGHGFLLFVAGLWDRIRELAGGRVVRWSIAIVALGYILWVVWVWGNSSKQHAQDLGPNLAASFLVFLLLLGKGR